MFSKCARASINRDSARASRAAAAERESVPSPAPPGCAPCFRRRGQRRRRQAAVKGGSPAGAGAAAPEPRRRSRPDSRAPSEHGRPSVQGCRRAASAALTARLGRPPLINPAQHRQDRPAQRRATDVIFQRRAELSPLSEVWKHRFPLEMHPVLSRFATQWLTEQAAATVTATIWLAVSRSQASRDGAVRYRTSTAAPT